jgi:hypothetical protein
VSDAKRVLIVGSGFSKAIFSEMPTVSELSTCFECVEDLVQEPYRGFMRDPELLLSYLGLGQPWNEPEEGLRNQALFMALQRVLADHIAKCEARAFGRRGHIFTLGDLRRLDRTSSPRHWVSPSSIESPVRPSRGTP